MIPMRFVFLLAASSIPMMASAAGGIRVIEPARHSMLPAAPDGAKAAAGVRVEPGVFKPVPRDVPSPVLVERVATVDAEGNVSLGCSDQRVRDFRLPQTVAESGGAR